MTGPVRPPSSSGIGGILDNLEGLATALGAAPPLAGMLTLVAVAALADNIHTLLPPDTDAQRPLRG